METIKENMLNEESRRKEHGLIGTPTRSKIVS